MKKSLLAVAVLGAFAGTFYTCPNGAITFGDLLNPKHKVHELIKSPYAFRLLERLGTDPQVYYLSRREWVRREGDNYLENEKTGEARTQG